MKSANAGSRSRASLVAALIVLVPSLLVGVGTGSSHGLGQGWGFAHPPASASIGAADSGIPWGAGPRAMLPAGVTPGAWIPNHAIGHLHVGFSPVAPLVDPQNGMLYIANNGENNLSVVDASNGRTVTSLVMQNNPTTPALDPKNGLLYVPNTQSPTVTVVNTSTNKDLTNISMSIYPIAALYDPGSDQIFALGGDGNVSAIDPSTNAVTSTTPSAHYPWGFTLDPISDEIYVPSHGGSNLSIINATTNTVVATIAVGSQPVAPLFDPFTNDLYMANMGSNNVTVIDGSTDQIIHTIPVYGVPLPPVVCGPTHDLYVVNSFSSNVTIINTSTYSQIGSVHVGYAQVTPFNDSSNNQVYVTNQGSNTVSVISCMDQSLVTTVSVGSFPVPGAFDPGNGRVYIPNGNENDVTVLDGGYNVLVSESGLPTGTPWTVNFGGIARTGPSGSFEFPGYSNGTYNLTASASGYVAYPYDSSPRIDGANVSETISFHLPFPQNYSVTFSSSGLPGGSSWSVQLNGTLESASAQNITFEEPNGTYSFEVNPANGEHPTPSSGSIMVDGMNQSIGVSFSSPPPATYLVTFTEAGLPVGTNWSGSLKGPGVNLTHSSASTTLTFTVSNGTYTFTPGTLEGWRVTSSVSTVVVNGGPTSKTIVWSKLLHEVLFTETGLPFGLSWEVTLNGSESKGTGPIDFTVPDGSYSYSVGVIAGYTASPSGGSLTVNGANVTRAIAITANGTGAPGGGSGGASFLGLPATEGYGVLVGIVAVAVMIGIAVIILRKRRSGPPPEPSEAPAVEETSDSLEPPQ